MARFESTSVQHCSDARLHVHIGSRFADIMSEWCRYLEQTSAANAGETSAAGNAPEGASVLAHINLHNAYHGGQIVLLRKLQGSWDAAGGVS